MGAFLIYEQQYKLITFYFFALRHKLITVKSALSSFFLQQIHPHPGVEQTHYGDDSIVNNGGSKAAVFAVYKQA